MAKFQPRLDIWTLTPAERAKLQPGQHITAGPDNPGVFLGQGKGGTVAMWEGNAKGRDRAAYMRTLRDYALRLEAA